MSAFSDALGKELGITPFQQAGSDVVLSWSTATTGPIFDDVVMVVLPDFHLASAGAGDIFSAGNTAAANRLLALVNGIYAAASAFPKLVVVHLGDLYDLWRAYPDYSTHPTSDYSVIENPYSAQLGALTEKLNARVCVGNHDGGLGLFPPAWARNADGTVNAQLAYGHLLSSSRVLAFHGHQEDTINQAMAGSGGSGAVRIATEVARLSNPISMAVQKAIDLTIDLFGDTPMSLTDLLGAMWPATDPPSDAHGFQAPRWSDRGGRATLQTLVQALPFAAGLKMVVVGHSHRPGISAIHVNGALVPLVDVGSWVWGRSQFAIACEGEVRLWQVQ